MEDNKQSEQVGAGEPTPREEATEARSTPQQTKQPVSAPAPSTNEPARDHGSNEASETPKSNRSLVMLGVIIAVGVVVAAVIYFMGDGSDGLSLSGSSNGAAVATVNGEEIPREKFNDSVSRTELLAQQQGLDPNDPAVREQIESQSLSVVVNTVLLIQAARDAGITVSSEEVDAQINDLETQYGGAEEFQNALTEAGLTNDEIQNDIHEQLLVDEYITQSPEYQGAAVSEEEIVAAYDSISAGEEGAPSLDEVRDMIEGQLLAQKQQQAAAAIIERLREAAEIEILI